MLTLTLAPQRSLRPPPFWTGQRRGSGRASQSLSCLITINPRGPPAGGRADGGLIDRDAALSMASNAGEKVLLLSAETQRATFSSNEEERWNRPAQRYAVSADGDALASAAVVLEREAMQMKA